MIGHNSASALPDSTVRKPSSGLGKLLLPPLYNFGALPVGFERQPRCLPVPMLGISPQAGYYVPSFMPKFPPSQVTRIGRVGAAVRREFPEEPSSGLMQEPGELLRPKGRSF